MRVLIVAVAVSVLSLLAACSSGPKIVMVNDAGQRVDCGSVQTPLVGYDTYVVAAGIANQQVKSCVEKYTAMGYGFDVPERRIRVSVYPALGPIHDHGQNGELVGFIIAAGPKGRFAMTRPDGVTCEGRIVTMQGANQASATLVSSYGQQIGLTFNTDGMVPGIAVGTCSNGATLNAEYYVVRGTDNGFGVIKDGDGNVYKVLSQ